MRTTDWNEDGEKTIDFDTKITGVPYYNSTRSQTKLKQKIRNKNMIVVEFESKTFDSPYSSCFLVHESWILIAGEENQIAFQRLMWFEFVEWTMS